MSLCPHHPASCPAHTQCPILSLPTCLYPQHHLRVLIPTVPPGLLVIAHGSSMASLPGLSHRTRLLSALHCSCGAGVSHASPVVSHPVLSCPAARFSLHADPTSPFPSLPMASCPCDPHHLQVPASSRLTTLNCPSPGSSHHPP